MANNARAPAAPDKPLTWLAVFKFLIPLVLVLVTLAVSWGMLNGEVKRACADVVVIERRLDDHDALLRDMRVLLAEMGRDLKWIREQTENRGQ